MKQASRLSSLADLVETGYLRVLPYALLCLLTACAMGGRPTIKEYQVMQAVLKSEAERSERTIAELQTERQALRQELGIARMAKSRLEGDLLDAERRLIEARHIVELQREELVRGVQERDRLAQTTQEVQAQMADMAGLRQQVATADPERGRLQTVEEALNRQSRELEEVKVALQSLRLPVQKQAHRKSRAILPLANVNQVVYSETPAGQKSVSVGRGDSLWKLARQFRVDLAELIKVNRLTSDVIFPGQELLLPDHLAP